MPRGGGRAQGRTLSRSIGASDWLVASMHQPPRPRNSTLSFRVVHSTDLTRCVLYKRWPAHLSLNVHVPRTTAPIWQFAVQTSPGTGAV